tara:strand:- start:4 stop:210 length:207 start_codon:yes stop_codon:yes gene_type:complete
VSIYQRRSVQIGFGESQMSDIGGVEYYGNDPFLSALKNQQQRALDISAQWNRKTQALLDDLGFGSRQH